MLITLLWVLSIAPVLDYGNIDTERRYRIAATVEGANPKYQTHATTKPFRPCQAGQIYQLSTTSSTCLPSLQGGKDMSNCYSNVSSNTSQGEMDVFMEGPFVAIIVSRIYGNKKSGATTYKQ